MEKRMIEIAFQHSDPRVPEAFQGRGGGRNVRKGHPGPRGEFRESSILSYFVMLFTFLLIKLKHQILVHSCSPKQRLTGAVANSGTPCPASLA